MGNPIELRHYHYFLAVAQELHFRKAAEKLYISQPGLSRQIKQMEEILGVQLFERSNRKVKLTAAGQYLKEEISVLLRGIADAEEYTKLLGAGIEGKLKVGYVGSAMQEVIPQVLEKCREQYPKVRFNFRELDNSKQMKGLHTGELDIGFVRMSRIPRGLVAKQVREEYFALVLPKGHSFSKRVFKGMEQLKEESFILFEEDYSSTYYQNVMSIFDEAGFVPIVSHTTVHAATIFKLVENGFGLSIVPTSLMDSYHSSVEFVVLDKIPQRTTLSVVWNKKNSNPILARILELL